MADRHDPTIARGSSRRARPSMTERQLHAYFLARDTVRRLRDAAMRTAGAPAAPPDRSH
jgi:hypothetical protein